MRAVVRTVVFGVVLLPAAPMAAQSEQALRRAFEGKFVVVRMDLPATHKGVDLYPDRDPDVDFSSYSDRVREFGIALREGERVMVTGLKVKKKNIEFQLAGGGYGVFGDDSGSVYVPTVDQSRREKDLEKEVKNERDPERRRRLQRELDTLRRQRERENRDREAEKRDLEQRKSEEIAERRVYAGSRVNVWLTEESLKSAVPTPAALEQLLSPVIDFGDDTTPRGAGTVRRKPGS